MPMRTIPGETFLAPLAFKSVADGGVLGRVHRGLALTYRYEPMASRQARWRGRDLIVPEIDLGRYTTRAVIDYLCFRVDTRKRMGAHVLNKIIVSLTGRSHRVLSPKWEKDHFGDGFIVTVNDPDPAYLHRLSDALRNHSGIRSAGALALLEVSIDWYPESGDTAERLLLTETLRRHLKPAPEIWRRGGEKEGWPRFAVRPGVGGARRIFGGGFDDPRARIPAPHAGARIPMDPLLAHVRAVEVHAQPAVDATTYFGPDDRRGVMLRVMDKVEDDRDPETLVGVPLPPESRRSRLEVRIGADVLPSLGLRTCDDLFGFDFQGRLRRRFFGFHLPTSPALPEPHGSLRFVFARQRRHRERLVFRRSGVLGLHLHQQAEVAAFNALARYRPRLGCPAKPRIRIGTGDDGYCRVHAELVKRTDDALHALSRVWRAR